MVLCYVAWIVIDEDHFARELLSAAIGAVVTLAIAGLIAMFALRKNLQRHFEKNSIRRFDEESWVSSSILAGGMKIPGMSVVASCVQGIPWTDRITVEFESGVTPRGRDPLLDVTRGLWLPGMLEDAQSKGYVLVDGERADMLSAHLQVRMRNGVKQPHYAFGVSYSSYFDFACGNAQLDREFQLTPEAPLRSLRSMWEKSPTSILDIGDLPIPAAIGSGTAVVTRDGRLVLGVRHRTYIAGRDPSHGSRQPVHVVAEGLLPGDVDDDGNFSPRIGVRRGLREELHIGGRSDHIARVEELVDTGFCFDQTRWQPYFTYLARIDRTWNELQTAAPIAADSWEAETLISLPFDIQHVGVRRLLRGEHPDLILASNHAAAAIWFALLYQHGYQQMRDELTGS